MDQRRLNHSVIVILVIFLFSLGRVVINSNPIYHLLEPVIMKLNDATKNIGAVMPIGQSSAGQQTDNKLALLEQENAQLREQLELADKYDGAVTAEVVRRDLFGFSKQVWIAAGENDSLRVGDTVLAGSYLFGVVTKTYDESASVQLVIDPAFRVTVESLGDTHGILKLDHGSAIIDLLPSKELEGQIVKTDGLDNKFRSGIPIGNLGQEIGQQNSIFGRYPLMLAYNPLDIDIVTVLRADQ